MIFAHVPDLTSTKIIFGTWRQSWGDQQPRVPEGPPSAPTLFTCSCGAAPTVPVLPYGVRLRSLRSVVHFWLHVDLAGQPPVEAERVKMLYLCTRRLCGHDNECCAPQDECELTVSKIMCGTDTVTCFDLKSNL